MQNMSHIRFKNTYNDLLDCYEHHMDKEDNSAMEEKYKKKLIELCRRIVDEYDPRFIENEQDL